MTHYTPETKWTDRAAIVAVTIVIGVGTLQWIAGAMTHPDPDGVAQRQQVLAAQGERAAQIRALENGEVRLATTTDGTGI